jgi:succinoglycan biosynthesis protein ExoL
VNITYFVHDLADPAVARRLLQLQRGGAKVRLVGFHRRPELAPIVAEAIAADLGATYDRRFYHRTLRVLRHSITAWRFKEVVVKADVLLARNLEMALLALAARSTARRDVPLVYECLDIHALQETPARVGQWIRALDRHVLRNSKALLISSPRFLSDYFSKLDVGLPRVVLTENKRIMTGQEERPQETGELRRPPWTIGWFGNLRCYESFLALLQLACCPSSLVKVVLRGRPTERIQTLIARHLPVQNMQYYGPYSETDLQQIYTSCDLTWGIERYPERGKTADWVLPNRLYEGGYYNSPMLALRGTATADWLTARKTGFLLSSVEDLGPFIRNLTPEQYHAVRCSTAAIPTPELVWTPDELGQFVEQLVG